MTVMQYDRKFYKLSRFAKTLVNTEKDRVEKFLHGLRPTIQKDLAIVNFATHAEALDKVLKNDLAYEELEQYQKREEKKRSSDWEDRSDQNRRQKVNDKNGKSNQQKEEKCSRCGGDHRIEECSVDKGVCFRCKKLGHKLQDCLVVKGACFHCKHQGHLVANCLEKNHQK